MADGNSFGYLLRKHRRTAGLTLEDLAARSGVSVRAISDLERAASSAPRSRTVEALLEPLDLTSDQRENLLRAAAAGRLRRSRSRTGRTAATGASVCLDLPPSLADFTGRARELAALEEMSTEADRPVVVIHGAGGLGKTTLAVHAAARMVKKLGAQELYVNLRGADLAPLAPGVVLFRLLRALGVHEPAIPSALDERSAIYRRLLRGRRVVLVLDNAGTEAQVRPLLPHDATTVTIVTSRRSLTGLGSVQRLPLGPMTELESLQLLQAVTGLSQDSARDLGFVARCCGYFPLALRIAGNRLMSRSDWSLADLVTRLADERRRIDTLTAGDLQIQQAFAMSYDDLDAVSQLLFRRLPLIAGSTFSASSSAVVAEVSERTAQGLLDELVELGLVVGHHDRYALHDLIRLYARDRMLDGESDAEHIASANRLRDWFLLTAVQAAKTFTASTSTSTSVDQSAMRFEDREHAAQWLETESSGWLDALHAYATEARGDEMVVAATEALYWFSYHCPSWPVWPDVIALGRDASRRLGDKSLEALHLNMLSRIHILALGQNGVGLSTAESAHRLATEAGDVWQQAWASRYAARACQELGRSQEALDHGHRAIELFDRSPDPSRTLSGHVFVADLLIEVGDPTQALRRLASVMGRLDGPDGSRPVHLRGAALAIRGRAHAAVGDWASAASSFAAAADAARQSGLRTQQGSCLLASAETLDQLKNTAGGLRARRAAYDLFLRTGDTDRANAVRKVLEGAGSDVTD